MVAPLGGTSGHQRPLSVGHSTPSGAKDDLPNAHVLLELLLRHRDKLTPLSLADVATRQLAGLWEARRDLVDRRTQLFN